MPALFWACGGDDRLRRARGVDLRDIQRGHARALTATPTTSWPPTWPPAPDPSARAWVTPRHLSRDSRNCPPVGWRRLHRPGDPHRCAGADRIYQPDLLCVASSIRGGNDNEVAALDQRHRLDILLVHALPGSFSLAPYDQITSLQPPAPNSGTNVLNPKRAHPSSRCARVQSFLPWSSRQPRSRHGPAPGTGTFRAGLRFSLDPRYRKSVEVLGRLAALSAGSRRIVWLADVSGAGSGSAGAGRSTKGWGLRGRRSRRR